MRRISVVWGIGAPLAGAFALSALPAQAQQSGLASAMLEEVVVTARRREESLEDLPLSIQAISADAMQAQGIYNVEAISDFVPNLQLQDDIRTNDTRIFIRGIGGGFSNPSQVFGVGMYVDGHYMSGTLGAFMSTVDVERVEVLRGPQGTLFGKNTTGGAVSLISAKPHEEFESYVTLRGGEFGQQDFRGMVNAPITDNLFFRGNFAKETSDGYYTNRFTGEDTGGNDQTSLGLALRWEVGDHWTVDSRISIARDRDENRGGQCVPYPDQEVYDLVTDPAYIATYDAARAASLGITNGGQAYTGPGPFTDAEAVGLWGGSGGGRGPGGNIDHIYNGAALDYINNCLQDFNAGPWVTSQNMSYTESNVDNDMLTINATWDSDGQWGAFENASIAVQGGWRNTGYWYVQDRDFSPLVIDHVGSLGGNSSNQGVNRRTDELEFIFNGDLTDRLHITAGLYYFDDNAQTGDNGCLSTFGSIYDPVTNTVAGNGVTCQYEGNTLMPRAVPIKPTSTGGFVGVTTTYGKTTGTSEAAYAHFTYDLSERWTMALGARAMQDDRTQENVELTVADCAENMDAENAFCAPTVVLNTETIAVNGLYVNAEGSWSQVTPSLSFTRSLDPGDWLTSGNVYFSYSEGYLTGAFNDEIPVNQIESAEGKALAQSLIPYDEESISNYEVGFKGTFNDGNMSLGTALFYMDYTDKQEAINISNPDGLLGPNEALEYVENVGEVVVTGIELELRSTLWEGGFLSLDAGYLNYDYQSFSYVDIGQDPPQQVTGLPPLANRTPEWTVTATVEHAFSLASGATLTPQLSVYTQAEYEWLTENGDGTVPEGYQSQLCHQDSYSKLRARLTYEPEDRGWMVAVWGNNITDEEILLGCGATRTGTYRWYHQPPAQWGAEFTMRFGNRS